MTKQGTVASLFHDALIYDEPYIAHFIYYTLQKKKVTLEDKIEKLYEIELTPEEYEKFQEIKRRDVLQMRPIKLYAIQRNGHLYDFYFAKTPEEAAFLHYQLFGEKVRKVIDAYNKMMDMGIYNTETKRTSTFRELMKEYVNFPVYVCTLEGGGS